ncbi:hypothetical protein CONPUDRAFT_157687 [Coniophora puteana RWD-64-598 SS2]|uniref:CxC5 like cysteine cluster associated with KDZ domain-containing protein n=1 Tax=Coniophora puteana (strain RWD-64-598) TaxID=741705 RepID=A0A5M3MEJ9_CONPW|nr:uncharacterized protein CONPUDRAFT_157687 [Coniophora puteana RWD-64-598 SS2]EIW77436.1 hypothetical protein CONPUDRAFT_157687 [Coniophora puteana RWD-64-598 SS2]
MPIPLELVHRVFHAYPHVLAYDLEQINEFLKLCYAEREVIALIHHATIDTITQAPPLLPEIHAAWIADQTNLPLDLVNSLWGAFKDAIWTMASDSQELAARVQRFVESGWDKGISYKTLAPPSKKCINDACRDRTSEMRKETIRDGIVFTFDIGIQWAKVIHLTCIGCGTNYRSNYYIPRGSETRIYYQELPEYLQVDDHHYVDARLANHWTTSLLIGATAATSLARIYEQSFGCNIEELTRQYYSRPQMLSQKLRRLPFSPKLNTDHVWTAFIVLALLRDCKVHGVRLRVPHDGEQRSSATIVMYA